MSGRANDGGLRIGEMERDSLISHGMTDFLTESMMERADNYQMAICNNSGMMSIYNPDKNLFFSPMCDGPIRFIGSIDGKEMHIDNVTKYGRNFSIVKVPYSMKLLIQELMAVNIQMRIITADNIEQMENMNFSKNIESLTGITDFDELQRTIKNDLRNKNEQGPKPIDNDINIIMKDDLGEFEPTTPDDSPPPDDSPQYIPGSPASERVPNSDSPPYGPDSPQYVPGSPASERVPNSDSPPYAGTEVDAKIIKNSDFKVGENVIYQEDTRRPKSQWTIKKVGPNFITIHRINVDGSLNIETDIKIVERNQIHRPGDIVISENISGGGILPDEHTIMGGAPKPRPPINNGQIPLHIDFKPVMVMGEGHQITTTEEPNPVMDVDTVQPLNDNLIKFKPNIQNDDSPPPPPPSSSEPATMKDLIDGNLTIKKV